MLPNIKVQSPCYNHEKGARIKPWWLKDDVLLHSCDSTVTILSRCTPVTVLHVTLLLQCCDSTVTLLSRLCNSDVTHLLQYHDSAVTMLLHLCDSGVTLLSRPCDSPATLLLHLCDMDCAVTLLCCNTLLQYRDSAVTLLLHLDSEIVLRHCCHASLTVLYVKLFLHLSDGAGTLVTPLWQCWDTVVTPLTPVTVLYVKLLLHSRDTLLTPLWQW